MRLFPKEEINGHEACPTYLYRWTLLRLGPIAVYLHHFVADDWSRDFHDHPKRFISIGLKGSYWEETPHIWADPPRNWISGSVAERFQAPWIRSFPATHQHRLRLDPETDCWTLVIVGPKVRQWGFWHNGHFIPWREYVDDKQLIEEVKSCA